MPHIFRQLEADPEYISYTRRQMVVKGSQLAISLMATKPFFDIASADASESQDHVNATHIGENSLMQKGLNSPDWRNLAVNSNYNAASYVNDPSNKIGAVVVWALGMDKAAPYPRYWDEQAFIAQSEKARPPENKNVIVAVPSKFPDYITGGGNRAPKDRSPNGPLGQYFERVIEQHPFANAYVCGNETNYAFSDDPNNSAKYAAETMVSFDKLLKHHNQHNKLLLAPGIADGGASDDYGVAYSHKFMMALQATKHTFWSPAAYAIHTYTAVKHDHVGGVNKTLNLIDNYWIGSQNELYIPESGYKFNTVPVDEEFIHASPQRGQKFWQKRNLIRHFRWCQQQMGRVAVCAQYTLEDDPSADFQSGLFGSDSQPYPAEEPFSRI
jgi:hypothetical protein